MGALRVSLDDHPGDEHRFEDADHGGFAAAADVGGAGKRRDGCEEDL